MMSKLQLRDRLILERAKQLGIPEPSDAEVEACARAELRAKAGASRLPTRTYAQSWVNERRNEDMTQQQKGIFVSVTWCVVRALSATGV